MKYSILLVILAGMLSAPIHAAVVFNADFGSANDLMLAQPDPPAENLYPKLNTASVTQTGSWDNFQETFTVNQVYGMAANSNQTDAAFQMRVQSGSSQNGLAAFIDANFEQSLDYSIDAATVSWDWYRTDNSNLSYPEANFYDSEGALVYGVQMKNSTIYETIDGTTYTDTGIAAPTTSATAFNADGFDSSLLSSIAFEFSSTGVSINGTYSSALTLGGNQTLASVDFGIPCAGLKFGVMLDNIYAAGSVLISGTSVFSADFGTENNMKTNNAVLPATIAGILNPVTSTGSWSGYEEDFSLALAIGTIANATADNAGFEFRLTNGNSQNGNSGSIQADFTQTLDFSTDAATVSWDWYRVDNYASVRGEAYAYDDQGNLVYGLQMRDQLYFETIDGTNFVSTGIACDNTSTGFGADGFNTAGLQSVLLEFSSTGILINGTTSSALSLSHAQIAYMTFGIKADNSLKFGIVIDNILAFGTAVDAPVLPLVVQIAPNGAALDFAWPSIAGKIYDLESTDSLTNTNWAAYNGNADIAATAPTNTLNGVATDGTVRFFRITEK
jgi:hypothetical protein